MNEVNHFRPVTDKTGQHPVLTENNIYPTVKRDGNYCLDTDLVGKSKDKNNFSLSDFLFVSCLAVFFVILLLILALSFIAIRKDIRLNRARQEGYKAELMSLVKGDSGPSIVVVDRVGRPLGCAFYDTIDQDDGVSLKTVFKDGPAAEAGLKDGDRILSLDEQKIKSLRDVQAYLRTKSTGDTVEVVFLRQGETRHTALILAGD